MKPEMITTKMGLVVPKDYYQAPQSQVDEVTNGCGPAGWKIDVVPDTIYGLNVNGACNPHDWMYEFGETRGDKEYADEIFLDNLNTIIDNKGGYSWFVWLRKRRAKKYYYAVKLAGEDSFN